jgi:hypothetical protein
VKKSRQKKVTLTYKEQLLSQIRSNEESGRQQVQLEHAFENIVVDSHKWRLQEEERMKVFKVRDQQKVCKQAWEHQMKVNQEKKAVIAVCETA